MDHSLASWACGKRYLVSFVAAASVAPQHQNDNNKVANGRGRA